jgi:hypothetical protein
MAVVVTHSEIRLLLRFSSTRELIGEDDGEEDPIPTNTLTMGRCSKLKLMSSASRPVGDDLSEGKEVMWLCDRSMASIRSLREDTTCCAAEESSRW